MKDDVRVYMYDLMCETQDEHIVLTQRDTDKSEDVQVSQIWLTGPQIAWLAAWLTENDPGRSGSNAAVEARRDAVASDGLLADESKGEAK
jgi:hypothetical protein